MKYTTIADRENMMLLFHKQPMNVIFCDVLYSDSKRYLYVKRLNVIALVIKYQSIICNQELFFTFLHQCATIKLVWNSIILQNISYRRSRGAVCSWGSTFSWDALKKHTHSSREYSEEEKVDSSEQIWTYSLPLESCQLNLRKNTEQLNAALLQCKFIQLANQTSHRIARYSSRTSFTLSNKHRFTDIWMI